MYNFLNRLTGAKARIEALEDEVRRLRERPHFREVSREFDFGPMLDDVRARVVEDFAPILKDEALRMLKAAMMQSPARMGRPWSLTADIAENMTAGVYQCDFRISGGTSFQVARYDPL